MNPLQKKCIYATAGFHLLLLLILFVGPGFFHREPKPDTLPVLKVIPLSAIEAAMTTGTAASTPPPAAQPQPQPPAEPVKPVPPAPEPPKPVVTQPVEPRPEVAKPVAREVQPKQEDAKPDDPPTPDDTPSEAPVPKPPKPAHQKIEVDLTPVVHKAPRHPIHDTSEADDAAADAQAERETRAEARKREQLASRIISSARDNLTASTDVEMPGESSAETANYGQIVKSLYYNAWILPGSAQNDDASPKVRIVVARDGSVISAHIIDPSGDAAIDGSVQRALDRVPFIQPFSENAKEKERTFIIKFDAQTKRML